MFLSLVIVVSIGVASWAQALALVSKHNPPHEQELMRLDVGAGWFVIVLSSHRPPCKQRLAAVGGRVGHNVIMINLNPKNQNEY